MNKNKDDILEEIILSRIKLFSKENYFSHFCNIIQELSNNIFTFRKRSSLTHFLSSQLKEKNNSSFWNIIFHLIFPLKSNTYEENDSNLNPICFQYLKSLCYIKIKKLINISNEELIPLDKVISIYFSLCEKQIKKNKEKEKNKFTRLKHQMTRKSLIFSQNTFINRNKFKINHKKLGPKNNSIIKPLDYSNSFTRLFIGETDNESIRERYLSNMVVKKRKELHLINHYGDTTIMYLKRMYKKLFKNEEKVNMDNDMRKIIKKFENDHKRIDNFKRSFVNNDRPHYMYNYHQNLLALEKNKQKEKYDVKKYKTRNKNISKNRSFIGSSEMSKNNNQETGLTLSYSKIYRNKSLYQSISNEKKKFSDSLTFSAKGLNSYRAKKTFRGKKSNLNISERKLQRNFSSIMGESRPKSNISMFLNNRKTFHIKNYLKKKDFYFS